MHLVGDAAGVYKNGEFVVWVRKAEKAAGATSMAPASTSTSVSTSNSTATSMSAASTSSSTSSALGDGYDVIAKAPISEDGSFELIAPVDEVREVFFYVLGAVGDSGLRMAPTKDMNLILEPGELTIHFRSTSQFNVSGGKYNAAVFNSWRASPEFKQARFEYEQMTKTVDGETETERRARVDAFTEMFNHLIELETQGRRRNALEHEDPLVRRLTIQTAWLGGSWILESLRELVELTPDDPWVQTKLAAAEEGHRKRQEERKIATGTEILDFTADTLDGRTARLADVRAECKVVLVEFWASWCGPCRVEIPHMKEAYEQYQGDGFEIVSFTIDDEREAWEIASEEEDLPWLNLGMGEEHEAAQVYSVTGVPKNYLVDCASGTILAKDLRGHKLDEKLIEAFPAD